MEKRKGVETKCPPPVPTYRIEPVNITARPTSGGSTRAAFSCSMAPDENLATIQWFFEPMEFGSGMGLSMMVESGFLTNGTTGVANVTIASGLADPGTSILVLDGVGNDQEGFYSCVATFSDGRMINSSSGALIYNGEKLSCIVIPQSISLSFLLPLPLLFFLFSPFLPSLPLSSPLHFLFLFMSFLTSFSAKCPFFP